MSKERRPYPLILSATQYEDLDQCPRRWWYKRVRRLPTIPKPGQSSSRAFGTVLHEVVERFLSADELGRGPDGEPIDLYPNGWQTPTPKFNRPEAGSLDVREQALVQSLVQEAISQGYIVRDKELKQEYRFKREVQPDPEHLVEGDPRVIMEGYKDIYVPPQHLVCDLKVRGNKRHLLGPKRLAKDPQMMLYAWNHLEELRERGEPLPEHVDLVQVQFVRSFEKPEARRRAAKVTPEQVDIFWHSRILPAIHRALWLRRRKDYAWHEQPGPRPGAWDPCNAYGGCPFMMQCADRENEDQYLLRVDRARRGAIPSLFSEANRKIAGKPAEADDLPDSTTPKDYPMTMSFKEKLAQKKAQAAAVAGGAPPPAAKAAPKPAQAGPEEPAAEPAPEGTLPPWTWAVANGCPEDCKACKGTGLNSKGHPCTICNFRNMKANKPQFEHYQIRVLDGVVSWEHEGKRFELRAGEVSTSSREAKPAAAPVEPKLNEADKTNLIEAARKIGAVEAPEWDEGSSPEAESDEDRELREMEAALEAKKKALAAKKAQAKKEAEEAARAEAVAKAAAAKRQEEQAKQAQAGPEPVCKACGDTGKNSKGGPCLPCSKKAQAAPAAPQAAPAPQGSKAPVAIDEAKAPSTGKGGKGRLGKATKGFVLCIDCVPCVRNGNRTEDLSTAIAEWGKVIAEAAGAQNPYELDPFKFRQSLVLHAEVMAEHWIETDMVILAHAESPDSRALIEALRPLASQVFQALR